MLSRLPPAVLDRVIKKLRKRDLKALSRVSKHLHAVVAGALWQSITIKPRSEDELHRMVVAALAQIPLDYARRLQFCAGVQRVTADRCPHAHEDEFLSDSDDEEESDSEYHWDLGTCISSEILGIGGIIPLRQPLIRSLSLTTDSTCRFFYDREYNIDLSPFRQLRCLRWRAPQADNLAAVSDAIRNNSSHLQKLELDFVKWSNLHQNLGYFSDEEDEEGITAQNYFARAVLRLDKHSPCPLLPEIRVLSLTQVPLVASMANAINFSTLASLTLRMCFGWDDFLERAVQLNVSPKLKSLEIQDSESVSSEFWDKILEDFLATFEGLEELFIYQPGPTSTLHLWECISNHHASLKRLVHHQRIINTDEASPYFEEEHDLPDLSIRGHDLRRISEDPSLNPLAKLDLEFIGLSCVPERLSGSDLKHYASWAVSRNSNQANPSTRSNETRSSLSLRDEFGQFADWVFGPEGIPSLQSVVFGDFAHGGRVTLHNLLCHRCVDGGSNYRLIGDYGPEWIEVRDEYRYAMEACPAEPLLGG
ncbi:aaa family atpase [Trichoderma arundinaceum]|uniref:Aaa family atpase n=1 Tax=Trichoderma arundinaceum TaxID=490622 RepID=A0A395NUS5_TRIAR|nr:aaa family atpase [Trichoderma arundinaceum]